MTHSTVDEVALFELANLYPSPHNGQPITVTSHSDTEYEISFDNKRGLQSTEISFLFSFVTMGVFVAHLEACGRALGHVITVTPQLPNRDALRGGGHTPFAHIQIAWNSDTPDTKLEHTLRSRQTSRKKYRSGLASALQKSLQHLASTHDMSLSIAPDKLARDIIWLNQRAVFDDMFLPPVRKELDHWLRYSHAEKIAKQDGLSYDCMELSGSMLKFVVRHYRILRLPILSWLIKQYYIRTMQDTSTVGYLQAPFRTEHDAFNIGQTILTMWLTLTEPGNYLHPFGTIVANEQAHRDFLSLTHTTDETDENFVVFIFRAGTSDPPIRSERIPYAAHLINPQEHS